MKRFLFGSVVMAVLVVIGVWSLSRSRVRNEPETEAPHSGPSPAAVSQEPKVEKGRAPAAAELEEPTRVASEAELWPLPLALWFLLKVVTD